MPDSTAQVVIIGAGIVGASIAYHLAACVPKKSMDEPRPEACDLNL